MKLEPKPVLDDIDNELKELESEKAQLQNKYERKQDKRLKNKLNDVEAKIQKPLKEKTT